MKSDALREFTALRGVLEKERDQLKVRLNAINAVLAGQAPPEVKVILAAAKVSAKKGRGKGRRKMSPEAKARISAAAHERWAKVRALKQQAAPA